MKVVHLGPEMSPIWKTMIVKLDHGKFSILFMPIQQASNGNGKTAEAIVVNNEKETNKAGVTDVKIVEK